MVHARILLEPQVLAPQAPEPLRSPLAGTEGHDLVKGAVALVDGRRSVNDVSGERRRAPAGERNNARELMLRREPGLQGQRAALAEAAQRDAARGDALARNLSYQL